MRRQCQLLEYRPDLIYRTKSYARQMLALVCKSLMTAIMMLSFWQQQALLSELEERIRSFIEPEQSLPAAGWLPAVLCRPTMERLIELRFSLNHQDTVQTAYFAERK
ncbi:hypothetical protein OK016_08575 [Vibrio chagasii]|nr:hypothetical protein [Vibrio chagasii]